MKVYLYDKPRLQSDDVVVAAAVAVDDVAVVVVHVFLHMTPLVAPPLPWKSHLFQPAISIKILYIKII